MKSIVQYDLNNNFIKRWEGCSFAANELKLDQDSIRRVCHGKRNKYHGFRWKFESENKI